MTYLAFFIILWTVIALAWRATDIPHGPPSKWYNILEQVILVPVTVIGWIKVAVKFIMEKLDAKKN